MDIFSFLHYVERKYELAFGVCVLMSSWNSLLASMHNLSVSLALPPSPLCLSALWSVFSLTHSSLHGTKDVWRGIVTPQSPLRLPADFFIKERDDEETEEGDEGIAEGTSGGKRWGQKGYGGGAIFRPAASSLAPSPSSSPISPRYWPCLCPRAFLRKMSALRHTHTH